MTLMAWSVVFNAEFDQSFRNASWCSPTGKSTTHADVNVFWILFAFPLNTSLAFEIRREVLDTGFASLTERWHLLHPFIQLDNNSTCVALPVATLRRWSKELAHAACTCTWKVQSFQLALLGTPSIHKKKCNFYISRSQTVLTLTKIIWKCTNTHETK